jgi:glucose/arabinose dehydrogenase
VPRGRLSRLGFGVILLSAVVLRLAQSHPAPFLAVDTPTPLFRPPALFTPIAPYDAANPFAIPTPTPSPAPPTATPVPTPLPTATPPVPLDVLRRMPAPSTSVLRHGMRLPSGFNIGVYAEGLDSVSYLAYGQDDILYASLPGRGAVVAIEPSPDPAQAGRMIVFAQGLAYPTGLAFHDGHLYVAEANQVVRFPYTSGRLDAASSPEVIVPNLPAGGSMKEHALGFGPDGKLYLSVPASCNACREVDYRRATLLRYDPDGTHEELVAQGLRDVSDLYWYPNTNQLLATNASRRRMGEDLPPDTIEYIYPGANFGWPFCHAGNVADPELGWPSACDGVPAPFQQLPAQTTPRGLVAYVGTQFPADYYGDIFVALYGSWERQVPVGYSIARLNVENGKVVGQEEFCTGWLVYGAHWGRPVDLIQAPDGSLLVSDDGAGAIYRIYFQG